MPVAVDRPVYTTRKYRAEDLLLGDVIRNAYGKWDVVAKVSEIDDETDLYVNVGFQTGTTHQFRTVALVDVQVVKPS